MWYQIYIPSRLHVSVLTRWLILLLLWVSCITLSAQRHRVYLILAEECPISIYMAKPIRTVMEKYPKEDVEFVGVFPSLKSTPTSARQFAINYKLERLQIQLDPQQQLTRRLGAEITPEVIITDASTDRILYRGRISNAYAAPGKMRHGRRINDLDNMLRRIQAGEEIDPPWLPAVGCFVTFTKG